MTDTLTPGRTLYERQIQFLAEYQYRMSASLLYQFQAMSAAATRAQPSP